MVPSARTRGHGHKLEHRRFPLNTRSPSVLCSDGALAQAAQRLWGLLLGDLPELPGRGPGHPALGVPAGAVRQRLEQRHPEGPASLSHAVIPCWTLQRAFYSQSFRGCAPTSASVAAVCHPCSLQSSCSAVMLVFQAWPRSRDPWLSVPPVCKYSGAGCLNVNAVCGMS